MELHSGGAGFNCSTYLFTRKMLTAPKARHASRLSNIFPTSTPPTAQQAWSPSTTWQRICSTGHR